MPEHRDVHSDLPEEYAFILGFLLGGIYLLLIRPGPPTFNANSVENG